MLPKPGIMELNRYRIARNFLALGISIAISLGCNTRTIEQERKIDTYENAVMELKETEHERTTPVANIDELEMEVNNGGFNQYFINSYGRNCFETLRLLKATGKVKTAALLEKAIALINPKNMDEAEFLEQLRKKEIEELYHHVISKKLNVLDE
ncbi:MAG: DUF4375 domain-containing protein, partial [Sphingobacteriales bacterium]